MSWNAIALVCATLCSRWGGPADPAARVAAYPIEPMPLRELVERADVIATVKVRAGDIAVPPSEWDYVEYEVVALEVDQLLKGDPGRTTIQHSNEVGVLCPSPARFVVGTTALAFLMRAGPESTSRAPDGFSTLARSYGSKSLEKTDLDLYVVRIKEQLAIQELPKGPERDSKQLEWLVRCAQEPATCWEGAYDLAPQGDPDASFFDERESRFAGALTLEHRQRLFDGFLRADPGDRGARCLGHLLDADRDPRLLAWLVARLRDTKEPEKEERSFQVRRLAGEIAARDARPEVAAIVKELQALVFLPRAEWGPQRLAAERRRLVSELLALYPQ